MGDQFFNRGLYRLKEIFTTSFLSLAYLLLSYFLVGFKQDQLILVFLFNTMFYLSDITRRFILGFSIFVVYWILFDYMKAFPNYQFNSVHIEDLYDLEKRVFGINFHGLILTPNEYWQAYSNPYLDVLSGLFYLMWVPVPLAFAGYLFWKNKEDFIRFSLIFLWVNLIGFVIYYFVPAAPPWYVQSHGYEFIANTPGNTGGLARFDAYFGISLFKEIYSKGSNVFAAIPSLHSAYPVIVVYFGISRKLGWINLFFIIMMIGIWFSAVYNSHHYVIDVLAGISCSAFALLSFKMIAKNSTVRDLLKNFEHLISCKTQSFKFEEKIIHVHPRNDGHKV